MNDIEIVMQQSKDIKLLYVEDDPVSRELILMILQELFADITIAVDGVDGLKKFNENKIDLIITDISMPNMNGFEMIEQIRNRDKDISIVILSAYSETEYFIKGIGHGVDGYLLKPFNMEQFLAILSNVIKSLQLRQEVNKLNERMDLALEGGKTAVLDWDFTNNSFYISSCWKEMLGFSDDELPNSLLTWKERVHRDDRKSVFSSLKQYLTWQMKYYENIHRLKHKDGKWIWILGRAQILYDEKGKAVRMIGTHTDITEEKELQLKASHQAQIIEQIHESVISIDFKGIIMSWNGGAENLFHYKADKVIGQNVSILYLDEDVDLFNENIEILMKKGRQYLTAPLVKKNKDIVHVDLSLSLLKNEKGQPSGIIYNIQDITSRKQAEVLLREQHKYLQSIIDGVNDSIMVIKEDYTVDLMNSALRVKLKNVKIADPEHPKCYEISHNRSIPCDGFDHPCPLRDVIAIKEHAVVVHDHYNLDGDRRYVEISATPLFDNKKNCIGIIESARDVTEHLETRDELESQKDILHHQAHHDALTGLPNRILFNDRLEQGIERSKRNKSGLALFFIDLDHFKEINDSLGHTIGDEVLKSVTHRLSKIIRKEDTLARLGGDEFTVIIEGLEQSEDASLLAEKIIDVLVEPIIVDENTLYVSSSIGISLYPEDGENAQDLLKYADAAMYKAKEEGRNNFQFYSAEMTELALERVVMEASLREALKNEDFMVYYQPQVNAQSNTLIGMEALVRWQHPTEGLVCPMNFIPLAESTGLIIELDRFVMKTAMTQMAKWYAKGSNPGVLALNLSLRQLQKKDFISTLENMIQETGCKPEWVELEVTEGQIMSNPEEAIRVLTKINALGITLSVDDFGTGYSSLAYLKKLPIGKLKIDRSFVQELPGDEEDAAITRSVIALAQSLNLNVIAEGVETKEQKEFLIENGCEDIQGYFYGKPMPKEEMEVLLDKGLDLIHLQRGENEK